MPKIKRRFGRFSGSAAARGGIAQRSAHQKRWSYTGSARSYIFVAIAAAYTLAIIVWTLSVLPNGMYQDNLAIPSITATAFTAYDPEKKFFWAADAWSDRLLNGKAIEVKYKDMRGSKRRQLAPARAVLISGNNSTEQYYILRAGAVHGN